MGNIPLDHKRTKLLIKSSYELTSAECREVVSVSILLIFVVIFANCYVVSVRHPLFHSEPINGLTTNYFVGSKDFIAMCGRQLLPYSIFQYLVLSTDLMPLMHAGFIFKTTKL